MIRQTLRSGRVRWLLAILFAAIAIPLVSYPLFAIPVEESGGSSSNGGVIGNLSNESRRKVAVARVGSFSAPSMCQSYRGEIRARRASSLAIRRAGELLEVLVDVGDQVRKGDLLARLDTSDLDVREQLADAELAAASANATEAVAGPRYQTLKAAAARVRQLTAQRDGAKSRLTRQQRLISRSVGSAQEFDDAKYALAELQAILDAATAELEELNEGTRAEQVAAAKAKRSAAEANRRQVDIDRNDSRIIAPYDAVVAERLVDEGEMLAAGKPVLRILEVNPIEAHFGVPVSATSGWQVGETLKVIVDGRSITGKISRMQPQVDPITRTRGVELELMDSDDSEIGGVGSLASVAIGQTATLEVPFQHESSSHRAPNQFWLPTESLVRGSRGLWSVYVADADDGATEIPVGPPADAVIELREVRIIRASSDLSLVQGMIREGEWVVVDGVHRIGPGVAVEGVAVEDFASGNAKRAQP